MHDPMTMAHEIKHPWWKYRPWPKRWRDHDEPFWAWKSRMTDTEKRGCSQSWPRGYRDTFITIWHVDPEKGGSDDSCGFIWPHLAPWQRERLKHWAWCEGHDPYFLRSRSTRWEGSMVDAEAMWRGFVLRVADLIGIRMSFDEAARKAAMEIHMPNPTPVADRFCFLPGYHTNLKRDCAEDRAEVFLRHCRSIGRGILASRRKWWQHPRWHIWHWRIQCHPIAHMKRRMFSRCAQCGKRFPYGYAPVSNGWGGPGPRWFRGEKDVYHMGCMRVPGVVKEGAK